jgi:hypothetical protein
MKKTKICSGCGKEKVIWKSAGKDKYCQVCWFLIKPITKSVVKKVTKIKKVSTRRTKQQSEYTQVRHDFLYKNEFCKARLPICTMWATEVHHMKGRIEELLTDTRYFLPVCRKCHDAIHEMDIEEAVELGFRIKAIT